MTTSPPTEQPPTTLEHLPLLLTVEEAADVLRIGKNGAYDAIADGILPAIRIGRRIRVPRAALAAMLNTHASAETSAGAETHSLARVPGGEE